MNIKELLKKPELEAESKEAKQFIQFESLLEALKSHTLNDETIETINSQIDIVNTSSNEGKELAKQIKSSINKVTSQLERKHKIVTKNHYRNQWMALGMSVFGLPLGLILSFSLDSMAYLAIGLPIGMGIGLGVGTNLDNKAAAEGKQLDLEMSF